MKRRQRGIQWRKTKRGTEGSGEAAETKTNGVGTGEWK